MPRKRPIKIPKKIPIRLDATSLMILGAKLKNCGATMGEIAEALNLDRQVVGDRMRKPEFIAELWRRLDPPEELLRQSVGQAMALLNGQIKEGMPQRLGDGSYTQVSDTQKDRGKDAAKALVNSAISKKIILEGGDKPVGIEARVVKGPNFEGDAADQVADIIVKAKAPKSAKKK